MKNVAIADTVAAPAIDWETFRNTQHQRDDDRLQQFEILSERDPVTGRILKGPTGPDTALLVKFSLERVFSKYETFLQGEPTWVLKEFITVCAPGQDKDLTRHSQVEPIDMWRFPREYERFKKGLDSGIDGTRLKDWKEMANETGLLKELDNVGIQTVEQLASTSDAEGTKYIRGFLSWKARARRYIEATTKTEQTINLEKKLEETQAAHKAEMDAMSLKIDQLIAALAAQNAVPQQQIGQPVRKPTYKRKSPTTDPVSE